MSCWCAAAGAAVGGGVPCEVAFSDDTRVSGELSLVGSRPLTLVPAGDNHQRMIRLEDMVSLEHAVEKSSLERPWVFKESGIVPVDLTSGAKLEVQRAVMEKTGQKQLSYYWFAQRGRVLHSLFELKLYAFWDALTQQRTDGALVRIITPVASDEDLNAAEQRLQGFVRQVHPLLVQYIPGKNL